MKKIGLAILVVSVGLIVSREGSAQSVAGTSLPPPGDAAASRERNSSADDATQNRAPSYAVFREAAPTTRRIFVRSHSLLVRGAVVEEKLLQRREFQQLGFVITRDASEADLILELRHDLFTKYVFSVVDAKTQIVLDGGKLSSLGGTVAGKVAKRFVKDMMRAGTP